MGGVRSTLLSSVNAVQENINDTLAVTRHIISDLRQDASSNMTNVVNEGLSSIRTITQRADRTVFSLTSTSLALAAALALSLLLYLTNFSPFLRGIVWVMFVLLCYRMIQDYVQHSRRAPDLVIVSEESMCKCLHWSY
jgi:hypothetical protein